MAEDVRALIDHLDLPRADVMGYSLGARITAYLAISHPERVRSAILGGIGIHLVEGAGLPPKRLRRRSKRQRAPTSPIRPDIPFGPSPSRRALICARLRHASAARARRCPAMRSGRHCDAGSGRGGSKDQIAGSPEQLAALAPRGQALVIPGRDHMLAVGDRVFKDSVLEFLAGRP